MELRESALWNEVVAITQEVKTAPPLQAWRIEIKAGGKVVAPLKLISVDILRHYRDAYGDEVMVRFEMGAGDFFFDIYPHRATLQATLFRELRSRDGGEDNLARDIPTQLMRAFLAVDQSIYAKGEMAAAQGREALNLSALITVDMQLLDPALERARLYSAGGIFKNQTPVDILKYVLTSVSNEMPLDDTNKILGVDVYDPPSPTPWAQTVIPHGTRFPEIPHFLQRQVGGIYPTGLGVYLQARQWFVYPLYDLKRYDKTIKSLTLINVPPKMMPEIERTYRTTKNQVIALVTGDVIHKDTSESQMQNLGNGVRYMDARKVLTGANEVGENKAVVTRVENSSEFVTEDRPSGLNNVTNSKSRITSNVFNEVSELARRNGSELQCLWSNSDMGLITPGMPVKYMYLKGDQIVELKGVVIASQHYVQTYGAGYTDGRHFTNTALHLFVEREPSDT